MHRPLETLTARGSLVRVIGDVVVFSHDVSADGMETSQLVVPSHIDIREEVSCTEVSRSLWG
jgi:hypothetical protein